MSICYRPTVFQELIRAHPTWAELKKTLESAEGGPFRIIEEADRGLALIRYEKGSTHMTLPYSRWFRSVVWDTVRHFPVSVAPPKATATPFPYSTRDEVNEQGVVFSEFLDGFMINCFVTRDSPLIQMTSRSKLDATGTFYSSKSFRQLFMEAFLCKEHVTEEEFQAEAARWLTRGPEEDAVSYSFLVQHKENRIVSPVTENRVVLIQRHAWTSSGDLVIEDSFVTFRDQPNGTRMEMDAMGGVANAGYAMRYADVLCPSASVSEVMRWIQRTMDRHSWTFQGVVARDREGNRWRFRSEKYGAVKTLRGNSCSVLERFSQLYTQNLVHAYLEYYPEDTIECSLNTVCMNQIIQTLYQLYLPLHVTKTITTADIDKMYLPHLYSLHGIYLTQLRSRGLKLVPMDVHVYFCKQPWQRIAFLLRKNKEAYLQGIAGASGSGSGSSGIHA